MADEPRSGLVQYPRARFLLAGWLLIIFLAPGSNTLLELIPETANSAWQDVAFSLYVDALSVVLLLLAYLLPGQVPFGQVLGRAHPAAELRNVFLMAIFMLLVAWAAIVILFYPMSLVVPDFVDRWLLDSPSMIHSEAGRFLLLPNLLTIFSLCIAAPVVEEILFRGLILHRLTQKRDIRYAVFWSSLIFGLLHPDVLGAFLFGIGMCALYVRTQSLFVPIICHCIYNFFVWLISFGYFLAGDADSPYSVEDFQADWTFGALALMVVVWWSYRSHRRGATNFEWRLPKATT